MATIGYMRVSTINQKFDSQILALTKFGVDTIYQEHESGLKQERKELNKAIHILKPGDKFVIFKLDRLARGTKQLLDLMEYFEQQNIQFISIQDNIDTSTPIGRFFFTIMGAFAEMEAELIRERVLAGLNAAKENGTQLGRPKNTLKIDQALKLYDKTDMTVAEIAKNCQISVQTIYYHLKKRGIYYRVQK